MPSGQWQPHAYICTSCRHPESRHLLVGGDLEGPYRCHYGDCGCELMRGQPSEEINRQEFERRFPNWPHETDPAGERST